MANHPQNSPRGLFAKNKVLVGNAGLALTGDSTAISVSGGVRLSGNSTGLITHNSTGTLVANGAIESGGAITSAGNVSINGFSIAGGSTALTGPDAALPGDWSTGSINFGVHSTGAGYIAVRTTGTTWKYLNVTVDIPT